jgi:hypothetical protein
MKKTVLGVVVLLACFGFAVSFAPARAADSQPVSDAGSKSYLSYTYVMKLKNGLTALEENVLPELKSRIQNNELSPENKTAINSNLDGIKISLTDINRSLENPDLVLLEKPQPQPATGPSITITEGKTAKELVGENVAKSAEETPSKSIVNLKKASLPAAIGLAAALAILWFFWFRKSKKEKNEPVLIQPGPANSPEESPMNPQVINLPGPQSSQQYLPDINQNHQDA